MTVKELKALIQEGESLTVEFKRDAPISDSDLVEAVVCLANTEGGTVLLGVEDDGTVTGLHKSHLPANSRALEALIANKTIPGVRIRIELVELGKLTVAALGVDKANYVVQTSDGRSPHRFIAGQGTPECRPMHPNEVVSRLSHLGQHDYSAQPLQQATWDDLDPLEFERLRQTVDDNARSDKDLQGLPNETLAQALDLAVRREGKLTPTVAGILIAGRRQAIREFVPAHEAAFQVMGSDLNVTFNEFYREPLVKLFGRFEELLQARNSEEEFSFGIQRIGVPLYPLAAFREALANALVHRDYAILNAVYMRIDPRREGLIISNPGGFVQGVTLSNLLVTGPHPRNRVLADAFKRLGLVERTGRGVERIFEAILGVGRRPPSYAGSTSSEVRVFIPGGEADLDFVRLVMEVQNRAQRRFDWPYLLTLRQIADEGELTTEEVAELVQNDKTQARTLLENMVELGLLESKGPKRDRSYHLSAGVFESIGKPSSYIHRKGVSKDQEERAALQFASTYGRITRSDVLELLPHLTKRQATYLLSRLVEESKLVAKGSKGGRFYEPVETRHVTTRE